MRAGRLWEAARKRPLLQDALLAGALVLLELLTTLTLVVPSADVGVPRTAVIVVWAVGFMAPLALRRRYPTTVMAVVTLHFFAYWPVGQVNEVGAWLAVGVAVYSAAAHGGRARARLVFAALVLLMAALTVLGAVVDAGASWAEAMAGLVFNILPFGLGWSLGEMTRRLRDVRSELQLRNRQLAAERDVATERAVLEERVRIARELHDVVAHHVSVMTVQASVARRLFDTRPVDARRAIGHVEEGGRDAIADLKQLVGVLRRDDSLDLAPQPRMAELPRLIAGVEQAGLPVGLSIEGQPRTLAASVELSAYRIVQEALTNTIKHARASRVDVAVRYRDEALEVEVVDDGEPAVGSRTSTSGRGLVGMRERVSVHGGTLAAGPSAGGGYRVRAVLPGSGP